ncbi:S1 family peptidase [Streptomyces sp. 4N509B]|uniref:S1 family peptidase n=1 Tax=Streptomyces sp. 4N509B TaxID=3457413 RepID=UPI003FD4FA89
MTHRRTSRRRLALATTGIAALVAGSFAVAQANATPNPAADTPELRVLSSAEAGPLAADLAESLGAAGAGSFFDAETGRLVVNVVDSSAVEVVEAAGAEARVVENTLAELNQVTAEVEHFAVPGTAWAVDPVSNMVKVTVDSTVTGEEYQQVRAGVKAQAGLASLERAAGEFQPYIAGGDPIYAAGARCSLGFNVTLSDGSPGFLTAGHCGNIGASWSDESGAEIGQVVDSVFPDADYALLQYTGDVDNPSSVNLYDGTFQDISGAAEAVVGQEVVRSGSTTGVSDGVVEALDVAVQYAEGTVYGTIQTDVCAEPGDSGGALFSGSSALGLTSGGSGNCSVGGTTFYQPVADALAETGASLP